MDGMITSKDVENFSGGWAAGPAAATVAPPAQSFMSAVAPGFAAAPTGSYSDVELTNMRKTIAKRLQASKQVGSQSCQMRKELTLYDLRIEVQLIMCGWIDFL